LGDDKVPRRDFIRLGALVRLGVAGSSVLSACGGGESAQGGGETTRKTRQASGEAATTSPSVGKGEPIVDAAFIPPGFAFDLAESGEPAILVHLPDESWAAYSAVCTHAGCEVGYQVEA
jgi:Rieske Fe-S protein